MIDIHRIMRGRTRRAAGAIAACVVIAAGITADIMAAEDPAPAPGRDEARRLLEEGERAFRRGMEADERDPAAAADHYMKAILNFERIAYQEGIRNGKLFYNIGNAYFRLGDLGRAILNYRRAEIFSPHDENLAQNLEYARSRRVNRVEPTERERIFKTLFFLHYDIPSRVRLLMFVASFALTWAFFSLRIFLKKAWIRFAALFLAAAAVLILVSLTVERAGESRKPAGVIVAPEVTARKGDADTYQPSFTDPLQSGTEFRVIEKRVDWWYIELEDGGRCWIPAGAGDLVVDWK